MSNTDRDSLLERWATGMETLEQYYENLYGPPATPATLPDVTNRDGMLEAIADCMVRAQRNINKRSSTYHNTETAYTKNVPAHTKLASIEQVGGKTVMWNQLQTNGDFSTTTGITPYNGTLSVSDGVLSFTATAVDVPGSTNQIRMPSANCVVGHTYLLSYQYKPSHSKNHVAPAFLLRTSGTDANISFGYFDVTENVWNHITKIITIPSTYTSTYGTLQLRIIATGDDGYAIGDVDQFKDVMLFDLTSLYEAGNEPTTVNEFQRRYPAEFYAYSARRLLNAGVTSVVSKDSSDNVLQTYTIPDEIKTAEGYGWSCPGAYNYVDFESKKFVQTVGSRNYEAGDESDATVITDGTNTHYALEAPLEFDVSAYLDDNTIEVESGGTLEFPNQHGADYKIPVPSTETFWVGVS